MIHSAVLVSIFYIYCVFFVPENVNGCPVFRRGKRGLNISEILEACVGEKVPSSRICHTVPRAVRENVVFVIDIKNSVDHRDLTADDNGGYKKHSSPM